ncbi:MAG: L,D-transpeptidase family protein [Gammaproteobacteria bacterium]|nr:L,D-transpeptidase family protein [Gammaproteobacteria bacterium]
MRSILYGILCWFGLVCLATAAAAPVAAESKVDVENPIVSELIAHLVVDIYEDWAEDLDWQRLRDFYLSKKFKPIWLDGDVASERARLWRDTLLRAGDEGLNPLEYHVTAIRYLWNAKRDVSRARLELLLTDAFFRYVIEARVGYQYPRLVDNEWYINPPTVKPLEVLEQVLGSQDIQAALDLIPPQHGGYQRLRTALARYRATLTVKGEWITIPPGPHLKLGSWGDQIVMVRRRLLHEGYPISSRPQDEKLFDRDMEQAVKLFQRHTGENPDGIVGPKTRYAMNLSLTDRIDQIAQNMERWRWLPHDMGSRYVMVNMAGYRLYVIEKNKSVFDMPVIIGKPYRATPAFADKIEYLEFNPTWSVPPRIAREEFLPKMIKDANFLKANNIRILENWGEDAAEIDPTAVDWAEMDPEDIGFKFEQMAGDHNSLGRVKFMFPNSFRVYLHDTPIRRLFFQNVRTFSSGCIRVSRPVSLATYLLGGRENGWSNREVRKLISRSETQRVNLPTKIPIYLLYWTAWVDDGDIVQFRRDIYNRDNKITTIAGGEFSGDNS